MPLKRFGTVIVLLAITSIAIFGTWQTTLGVPLVRTIERPSSNIGKTHASAILLSLSENYTTVVRGSPAQIAVHVSTVASNSFRVSLSVQQVPTGVTVSFKPASGRSSFTSVMTILAGNESSLGRFNLTISASGGGVTRVSTLTVLVVAVVHDLAVIRASAPATATIGSTVVVNATVANYGSVSETFLVRLSANNTIVASQSSLALLPATEEETSLSWTTTGYSPGQYTLVVMIPPVVGESDIADNQLRAGNILLSNTPTGNPPPTPSPGASQPSSTDWRDLAIAVAIAWIVTVALAFFRRPLRTIVRKVRPGG